MVKKKKKFICVALAFILAGFTACGQNTDQKSFSLRNDKNIVIEEVDVIIPTLEKDYDLLYISDLHAVIDDEYINESDKETVEQRKNSLFIAPNGKTSADNLDKYISYVNKCNPDAVLFGGDMIDFASPSTVTYLSEGLSKLNVPYIYVRADHDLDNWWCDQNVTREETDSLHENIDGNSAVFNIQYPEFQIIGWNDSTSQMTQGQLDEMKSLFASGKPVILITHVPFASNVDGSLAQASKEAWQDRSLVWGNDSYYVPNEITSQFMEMVYAEDSPVVEILCGHLHLTWDGMIDSNTHEHVFSAAAYGNIGYIKIRAN